MRIDLATAETIAREVVALLAPYCTRIEIAGSIRRRRPDVGDIEVVAIPRVEPVGLWGDEHVHCGEFCRAVNAWPAVKGSPSGRYTQRILPTGGVRLDLFMCRAENWGNIFAIRTGSAEFSYHVLAAGWVRAGYTSRDGMLHRGAEAVPCLEEVDCFRMAGVAWVDPAQRR
jgi:DNA polymerase/3'-5' exonuclease PolX